MTTIEDIEQELKRRIEEHARCTIKYPHAITAFHKEKDQSDRALLTAIEGLKNLRELGDDQASREAEDLLQTILNQWKSN